jgi:hypothetical protein
VVHDQWMSMNTGSVDEHEQWQCTEVDEHGQQRRVEWAGPNGLVRVDGGTRRGVGRGPKS